MNAAVGVDVGGSFVKAVRLGPDGAVEERRRLPTPAPGEAMIGLIGELAEAMGSGLALGVGLAGLVDRGVLVWAPHLPAEAMEVEALLRRRLGVPVVVDNDANLTALAEHRRGAARDASHALVLTLGTGIGMGLILEGSLYRGRGYAGEVGHVTVDVDGDECSCGRKGCWETKVSGDLAAGRVSEAAHWLALGIEALVLALDPGIVVVAGGAAAEAGDPLLEPARRRLRGTEGAGYRALTPVVAGILGPDAGAIGAAISATEVSRR